MNRSLAVATLATALGLVAGTVPQGAQAQQPDPRAATMAKMAAGHMEKCYGIAARGKNDCAQGAHSCAGQATRDRDPGSFVLLPTGACSKIAGGSLKAS
jgi:uncharacterized membrane protein